MAFHWHHQYIAPLVRAANARDEQAVKTAQAQAQAARDSGLLTEDEQLALALMLLYVGIVKSLTDDNKSQFGVALPGALAQLKNTLPVGPESDEICRTCYMQLSILGVMHGFMQMTIEQFRELITTVSLDERFLEQWHYITALAFVLGDYETVLLGYEAFLENHSTYQVGFLFRRYDVMSKIVAKQAVRLDVLKLIEDAALPGHIREVERVFWPRFKQLGLVDPVLQEMLHEKMAHFGYPTPLSVC